MGVMTVIESLAGQMNLHMALNYSRDDDKRYKNVQVAKIERHGRVGESADPHRGEPGPKYFSDWGFFVVCFSPCTLS
jgi:hypothetical protein